MCPLVRQLRTTDERDAETTPLTPSPNNPLTFHTPFFMQKKRDRKRRRLQSVRVAMETHPLTPSPPVRSLPRAVARETTPAPRLVPRTRSCSHVALGCCCQGQRLGAAESGGKGREVVETVRIRRGHAKSTSLLNTQTLHAIATALQFAC
jgi:hypothetical protein